VTFRLHPRTEHVFEGECSELNADVPWTFGDVNVGAGVAVGWESRLKDFPVDGVYNRA
jgi:hypothetical protein